MLQGDTITDGFRSDEVYEQAPALGALLKRAAGISPKRAMPPFARETFKAWFDRRGEVNPNGDPVLLFPDTFNNYLHPEVLKATTEVLEAAGRRVIVPQQPLCCGRPLYDYGMLDLAKAFWHRMLSGLRPYIREGVPVVGAEPSCVAAFRDELPNMLPHDQDAKRLNMQTVTLAEFLERHASDWEVPKLDRRSIVHGHCHQEATMGMSAEQSLYERMGLDFQVLDSGCCGMAGSFGFEASHYDVSVKIGEHRLLPKVREAASDTLVIADGFSCKTQVEELSQRRPLHTAQVMKMAIEHGRGGVAGGGAPERAYPDVVLDGGAGASRTVRRTALGMAAVGGLAAAGAAAMRGSGGRPRRLAARVRR
jgi:Fe-S oxidoreductase